VTTRKFFLPVEGVEIMYEFVLLNLLLFFISSFNVLNTLF
jgi:hypothetical protein